jgi:crotonobetainyl-CoA:carnitine CoA-transferase CaiB-like acyl-CoA transferase
MFKPLTGVRVIDLTQVLAGPYATYQLGLLGAEVIKVEPPQGGDWSRTNSNHPDLANDMGLAYLTQGGNKKSVALNIKTPEGLAVLKRLIASADIFVENFRPGTATRLGLSFDAVKAVNNRILYCSISAYGQDGPIGHRPAYDHVVQGMCGIMSTTGTPDTVPNKVGAPYVDYATGLNAAFAITAGLLQVRQDGQARYFDVAMLDTSMLLMASMVTQTMTVGTEHGAYGNEAFSRSPSSGAFQTTDGVLMIAANNERQFRSLCEGIGRPDILEDARWQKPNDRKVHAASLREEIENQLATRSAAQWEQVLDTRGVPAARVRTIHEVLNDEQLGARKTTTALEVRGAKIPVHLPTLGFKVDADVVEPSIAPPRLGSDTAAVLQAIGVTETELEHLSAAQIVRCAEAG